MTEKIKPVYQLRDQIRVDLCRVLGEKFDKPEFLRPLLVQDFREGSAFYRCPVCDYGYFVETRSRRVHERQLCQMEEVARHVRLPFIDDELPQGLVFKDVKSDESLSVYEVLGMVEKYDESHSSIYLGREFVLNLDFGHVYHTLASFTARDLLAGLLGGTKFLLDKKEFEQFCDKNAKAIEEERLDSGVTPVRNFPRIRRMLARVRGEKK